MLKSAPEHVIFIFKIQKFSGEGAVPPPQDPSPAGGGHPCDKINKLASIPNFTRQFVQNQSERVPCIRLELFFNFCFALRCCTFATCWRQLSFLCFYHILIFVNLYSPHRPLTLLILQKFSDKHLSVVKTNIIAIIIKTIIFIY